MGDVRDILRPDIVDEIEERSGKEWNEMNKQQRYKWIDKMIVEV